MQLTKYGQLLDARRYLSAVQIRYVMLDEVQIINSVRAGRLQVELVVLLLVVQASLLLFAKIIIVFEVGIVKSAATSIVAGPAAREESLVVGALDQPGRVGWRLQLVLAAVLLAVEGLRAQWRALPLLLLLQVLAPMFHTEVLAIFDQV